ncbi:hypothetical protein [Luteolibacter soli]|uniref:Lipoprotein n=1 Tax=Luteolibacter soli TaxID=3135280 RepID=A0ABU9AU39_9BACT
MKTPPYLLVVVLASLSLSSCARMASGLATAMIESALHLDDDSGEDYEKDAFRAHLRHGDSVSDAHKAASGDRMLMEMERDLWLE